MYIIVSEGKEKQKTVWVDNYDCSRAAYNVRLAQQRLCFRWDSTFLHLLFKLLQWQVCELPSRTTHENQVKYDQSPFTYQFLQCTYQPKMYPIRPRKRLTKTPSSLSNGSSNFYPKTRWQKSCQTCRYYSVKFSQFSEGSSTTSTFASRQVSNSGLYWVPRGNARLQKWKTTPAGDSESTGFPCHSTYWDTRFWIRGNKLQASIIPVIKV